MMKEKDCYSKNLHVGKKTERRELFEEKNLAPTFTVALLFIDAGMFTERYNRCR